MRKTIAEIILLWLGIGLLCPPIALSIASFLLSLPKQKADGQIIVIFSGAILAFFPLYFL